MDCVEDIGNGWLTWGFLKSSWHFEKVSSHEKPLKRVQMNAMAKFEVTRE
jgi:hypothetical protein